jgi:hypothetical protein
MRWSPVALVLLAACPGKDTDTDPSSPFAVVGEGLPNALLSIQGTSAADVWAVGAGAPALHYDGTTWETIDVPTDGDLWWVHPTATRVTLVGQDVILELDRATGAVTEAARADGITFFGVWAADEQLIAVGGDIYGEQGPALWKRYDTGWAPMPELAALGLSQQDLLYKVHGAAADDWWIVGTRGLAAHWDGSALTKTDAGTTSPLFTVHAGGPFPIVVGGFGQSTIEHWTGSAWTNDSPAFTPQTNGVSGRGDTAVAVGNQGSVLRWDGSAWNADPTFTAHDLHGVWLDDEGGVWAVGGAISSGTLTDGVLAYDGSRDVPSL